MVAGKRILICAQNLRGAGHFVRSLEIGRSLAADNEVYLTSGSRPVPRPPSGRTVHHVSLPAVYRKQGRLLATAPDLSIDECLRERRATLHALVEQTAPDYLLIEAFPFSKWVLYDEYVDLITLVKAVNSSARVVSIARDILAPVVDDPPDLRQGDRARAVFSNYFDGVLIHSDPNFIRVEESVGWAPRIEVPLQYTGYVSEKIKDSHGESKEPAESGPHILVSCGGDGWMPFVHRSVEAWDLIGDQFGGGRMTIMMPLHNSANARNRLVSELQGTNVTIQDFATDFLSRLQVADLSISQAGYNTSMNLLETRRRSILVPHPDKVDQLLRSPRFVERGLAQTIHPNDLRAELLATAIRIAFSQPPPQHDIDLDGAAQTPATLQAVAS